MHATLRHKSDQKIYIGTTPSKAEAGVAKVEAAKVAGDLATAAKAAKVDMIKGMAVAP